MYVSFLITVLTPDIEGLILMRKVAAFNKASLPFITSLVEKPHDEQNYFVKLALCRIITVCFSSFLITVLTPDNEGLI